MTGAILVLLIFFGPKWITAPVRGFFLTVAYPFQKILYLTGQKTGNFFSLLSSISALRSENEKLLEEKINLISKVASLQNQEQENKNLREQLDLAPREKYDLEASFVIGRSSGGQDSWMLLDKGAMDGISVEMPVIVSDGILIGRISEVYPKTAKVVLLSDSSSSVNAKDTQTGARGIVRGRYNLGLDMEMIEQTDVLNLGDDVVTSGLGGTFPEGLLIGTLGQIDATRDKLFQRALIQTKVDYSKLSVVFVIKD